MKYVSLNSFSFAFLSASSLQTSSRLFLYSPLSIVSTRAKSSFATLGKRYSNLANALKGKRSKLLCRFLAFKLFSYTAVFRINSQDNYQVRVPHNYTALAVSHLANINSLISWKLLAGKRL